MKSLDALAVFAAVVEHGSFSAAAQRLGVSKSAVSKRVSQLEDELGVRLLHRTTRRLSLTEAGERCHEHAVLALRAARDAVDAATELQVEPHGLLRVSSPMSFGRLHIAPLVPELLHRYPRLRVELVMDDRRVDLVEGGFDVAIRVGDLPDSSLVARRLAACRHVLCAAPEYLERHPPITTPADLLGHNCLVFSYASDASEWSLEGDGRVERVAVSGSYRVNNSEALLAAVCGGLGIGRLPTFVAGPALAEGKVSGVLPGFRLPVKTVHAVFPERQHLPAKTRAFIDFAREFMGGEEPYWDRFGQGP